MNAGANRNIELKARLHDRDAAIAVCQSLGARLQGDIHQRDTYFRVPEGRLKLREAQPGRNELIFYHRSDEAAARGCDYRLEPATTTTRAFLDAALGTLAVVDKIRTLYLWENVRIHLDRVQGLGHFIEFEAVLDGAAYDDADGHAKLARLSEAFGLSAADLCPTSYLEMRMGTAAASTAEAGSSGGDT